jgi:hypothetical protein
MFAVSGLLIVGGLIGGFKTASAVQDNNYFYNRQNIAVEYPGRGMMGWSNYQPEDEGYGYPRGMMGRSNYQTENGSYGYPRGMMGGRYSQSDERAYGFPGGMMGGRGWQKPLEEGETLDQAAAFKRAQEFIDLHNLDLVAGDITENSGGFFEIEMKDQVSGEVEFKIFADYETGLVFPEYCYGNMGRINKVGN